MLRIYDITFKPLCRFHYILNYSLPVQDNDDVGMLMQWITVQNVERSSSVQKHRPLKYQPTVLPKTFWW